MQKIDINKYDFFHDKNLFLPTRTIYFGGQIEGESDVVTHRTISQMIKNLHILEHKSDDPITIILNTCGGSWEDGIALYDMIKTLRSPVNFIGMGKIYSMGSVIIQSGNERFLTENTMFMIHDGSDGFIGDAKSYEKWAEVSKTIRETMYEIFYKRMKQKNKKITKKKIEQMCSHDNIFTAKECVELGLADEVMKSVKYFKE